MENFFNPENKVMVALGHVADYMILSFLWFICSIPIITIGPATAALYYASMKILNGEETYIVKDYFHSFKQNFKQCTLLWLAALALGIICVVDILFYRSMNSTVGTVGMMAFSSIALMYAITMLYLFPYVSRFYCTFLQAIKSAFLLSIRHLGWTILIIIGDVLILLAAYSYPFLIMFLPGLLALFSSWILNKVFKRYIPEQTDNGDSFSTIDEIDAQDALLAAEGFTPIPKAKETSAAESVDTDKMAD